MLRDDDLDAAVSAGLVTQAQADALRTFAHQRRTVVAADHADQEHFRFMRGFNDVFFAIGVILIVAGTVFFTFGHWFGLLLATAIVWGLAELLVGRLRLVLPGILLAGMFVALAYYAVPVTALTGWASSVADAGPLQLTVRGPIADQILFAIMLRAGIGAIAAGLFFLRFRLPFALLPFAASLVIAVVAVMLYLAPGTRALMNLVLLAAGLGIFAVAARFDFSDPQRVTRRADCAFWLHLAAAPLIVHASVSLITPHALAMMPANALATVAIVVVLSIVALIIDRRALLVSALSYLGVVIFFAISSAGFGNNSDNSFVFFTTLIALGAFILGIGIAWQALRRRLVPLLSPSLVLRLPPLSTPS